VYNILCVQTKRRTATQLPFRAGGEEYALEECVESLKLQHDYHFNTVNSMKATAG